MSTKKKWDKPWKRLLPDDQDLYLTLLWRDGYSEQAITDFFRTTKGRIVRRRHDLRLPSGGRGKIKSKVEYGHFRDLLDIHRMDIVEKETSVVCIAPIENLSEETGAAPEEEPDEVAEETSESGLEAPAAPPLPKSEAFRPEPGPPDSEQRTASRRKPRYQIVSDWRKQCVHRDKSNLQCAYEWADPVTRKCNLHK